MYNKQVWKDEIPDLARPILDGSGKQKTDPQTGRPLFELVQEGTRITSTRLNTMEGGIEAAHTLVEQLAKELGGNFVAVINGVMGLQCSAQGLTVTWTAGVAYVGGRRFEVSAGNMPLNPTQGQYLYVDTDGIVKKTTSQATAKAGVLLFYVATDSSGVISSMDQRLNISMEEILKKIDSTATTAALDATAKAEAARVSAKTYTDDQVKGIADKLDTVKRQDVVLNAGMQILNAQRNAAFTLGGIKGRTLVNLLGRNGGMESLTGIGLSSATVALDSTNKTQGSNGLRVTTTVSSATNSGIAYIPISGLKVDGYYVLIADVKNGNAKELYAGWGGAITGSYAGPVTAKDKFTTIWRKNRPNSSSGNIDLAVLGDVNTYGYYDAVRIYEISATEYAALDTMTPEQVAAKYPYVDSVQPVRNPYVIRYGENIAYGFPDAKINGRNDASLVTVLGPYEIKFSGEAIAQNVDKGVYFDIPVIPGHSYTAAVDTLADNAFIRFEYFKDSSSISNTQWLKNPDFFPTNTPATVNVPEGCSLIRVYITNQTSLYWDNGALINDSLIGGNYHFKNWRLFHGTKDLGFKPREDSMLALQTDLYADPLTGANADEVFEKDGQYFKLAKWKKVVLDGDKLYTLQGPVPGFKWIKFAATDGPRQNQDNAFYMTKFDGKCIRHMPGSLGSGTLPDQMDYDGGGNLVYVSISNTDSGWGDNYTPTADEIKAYFMGYKMYPAGGSGSDIYTGSGTKAWVYRTPSGLDGWQDVGTTLPTSPAPINAYWQPYQLVYQLATPTVEPIVSEGMLAFREGDNQIEVGAGIVVREAIRLYDGEQPGYGAYYYTNHATIGGGSKWKYKPMKVLSFYRNSLADGSFDPPPPGSDPWYRIKKSLYDSSATYSVTYLMLDNSPIVPFTGSYAINEKAMLQELTETVQQNATAVSVLMNKKADKDQTIAWITPTLLNGWTSFGSNTVQYGKDAIGNVHIQGMAGGGAGEQPMFILPVGFRPKRTRQCVSIAVKDGVVSAPTYEIAADGKVIPYGTIAPTWMTLDTITPFPAER
ncbi:hypothetical protein ABDI30_15160 [Paenibacillus cisolokensis]|uniref:hypothetical protein n=1 Tax=Paenibacillus cisolokensis TaxID=1658519 RepID=UPI003D28B82D